MFSFIWSQIPQPVKRTSNFQAHDYKIEMATENRSIRGEFPLGRYSPAVNVVCKLLSLWSCLFTAHGTWSIRVSRCTLRLLAARADCETVSDALVRLAPAAGNNCRNTRTRSHLQSHSRTSGLFETVPNFSIVRITNGYFPNFYAHPMQEAQKVTLLK